MRCELEPFLCCGLHGGAMELDADAIGFVTWVGACRAVPSHVGPDDYWFRAPLSVRWCCSKSGAILRGDSVTRGCGDGEGRKHAITSCCDLTGGGRGQRSRAGVLDGRDDGRAVQARLLHTPAVPGKPALFQHLVVVFVVIHVGIILRPRQE